MRQTHRIAFILGAMAILTLGLMISQITRAQDETTATPNINWVSEPEGILVRGGPGLLYGRIGQLPHGSWVQPLARNEAGDWILITYLFTQGWVYRDTVSWRLDTDALPIIFEAEITPIPRPTNYYKTPGGPTHTPNSNWVRVGPEGAHVRGGPGQEFLHVGELFTGDVVDPVARNNRTDWILIRYGDGYGWVMRGLVVWTVPVESLPVVDIPFLTPSFTGVPGSNPTASSPSSEISSTPAATVTTSPQPSATFTNTATDTPSPEPSATPTETASATDTPSPEPIATSTPTTEPTQTNTPSPEPSATPTETPSATDTPTAVATQTNTPSPEPSATPTETPSATDTLSPEPTATSTSSPEPTAAAAALEPTDTFTPPATNTASPTLTDIPTETSSPTSLPTDTLTPTITATETTTATNTPSPEPTATNTPTVTPLPTGTPTLTATLTLTATPDDTATPLAIAAAESDSGDENIPAESMPVTSPDNNTGGSGRTYLLLGGMLALVALVYLGTYVSQAANLDRYQEGFPLLICPVCEQGELHLEERRYRILGIPRIRRVVRCSECRSILREVGRQRWRYAIDRGENPALYDELNGHIVSESRLMEISPEYPTSPPHYIEGDDIA